MKSFDPNSATRVWDRVQNNTMPAGDGQIILNLAADELLEAVTWQRVARHLPPGQAAVARQISQQEQNHVACLRGIYTMITGRKAIVPNPQVPDDPADIVLRRCYGRKMRALSQYESRLGDPQYGHVFRMLARQEQEQCHKILEILGTISK